MDLTCLFLMWFYGGGAREKVISALLILTDHG